jgi:hypothetical protein
VGSFIDLDHDKIVSNSSAIKTYEASGFNILCWLFGCCLGHKCCQMPSSCMSHHTLIMSFWPNMVWTTFSKMFFSICITSKVWQICKCCHLQDSPIIIHPHNNNLSTFQSNDNKTKRYTWHLNVIATLNKITFK